MAVCAECLGPHDVDPAVIAASCEGRLARTIYASDDLAFPGIGLPSLGRPCPRCARETVPIAVTADVARDLGRRSSR